MKKITCTAVLVIASFGIHAQGNFVFQTNASNPINAFANSGTYRGAAWVDFNNDGLVDFHAAPGFVFRNMGAGQFAAVANQMSSGTPNAQGFASCSWADYDNDGDIDCFICSRYSRLYRNDGMGSFTADSMMYAVVGDYTGWAAAMGDANNDSRMDLVIAYANGFHPNTPPTPCIYFNQDSAGLLQRITGYAFTDSLGPYTVPYWSDYDLDGDQDLFVASGPAGTPGYDFCYRNLLTETGTDTLERITNKTFATDKQDGQCYNFVDYDNDEDRDLCITNYFGATSRLYRNDSGMYVSIAAPFATTASKLSNCWGDYDNDGDQDVIVTADAATVKYFRNDGSSFTQITSYDMTSRTGGSGISNCDYDNDGDLDVFIMGTGTAKGLYINDSIALNNNSISVKCTGSVSNKSAIGTIVRIKATIGGQSYWQLREVSAMNTFMGHNDLRIHFGLGNATVVDSLIITYLSGTTEVFTNVLPNLFYANTEGSGMLSNVTEVQEPHNDVLQGSIVPNPANDHIMIRCRTTTNEQINYSINSVSGKLMQQDTPLAGDNAIVNVKSYAPGTYFITLRSGASVQLLKFIKK